VSARIRILAGSLLRFDTPFRVLVISGTTATGGFPAAPAGNAANQARAVSPVGCAMLAIQRAAEFFASGFHFEWIFSHWSIPFSRSIVGRELTVSSP
jgi:hypothetical protein